jgi:hypothetical protein
MTVTVIRKRSQYEVTQLSAFCMAALPNTYPNVPDLGLKDSTLLQRPPLRFQCVGGCSDRVLFICHPNSSSLQGGQGLEDKRERFVPLLVFYNKIVKIVTCLV